MKTEYEKAVACEMVDSYCKQILCNLLADYLRKKNSLRKHEIPMADMELYIDTGNELSERTFESILLIEFEGHTYPLKNEPLHNALCTISERFIGVLQLKYWHRMNDLEIALHFQISERTVRYWRKHAIAEIKRWYQRNHIKLDYPSRYKWLSEGECTSLRNLSKFDLSAEKFDDELNRLVDAYQGRSDTAEGGLDFETQYYVERRLLSGEV